METETLCEEHTGLFIVRNCENTISNNCAKCNKKVCTTHAYDASKIITNVALKVDYKKNNDTLCITCFTKFDTRLTNNIELYSKDRAVWRKKMVQRFHAEYPYMLFMAEDYGSLFNTGAGVFMYHDSDDDGSYFDS